MRPLIVFALPCLINVQLVAAPGPADEEVAARAQERFRLGVDKLGQPAESRRLFGQAADDLGSLRDNGYGPAFYLSLGNAEALAGRWPKAIWAYQCGLQLDPNDAILRDQLDYARSLVNYPPGNRGRPVPNTWPRWLYRPNATDWLIIAGATYSLAWVAGGWWYLRRNILPAATALGLFAMALASAAGMAAADAASVGPEPPMAASATTERTWRHHPLVVIATDTPLHRGNGPSYPLQTDVPMLPAGLEAHVLHQRGAWLQVRLTTGETGWIPRESALVVDAR